MLEKIYYNPPGSYMAVKAGAGRENINLSAFDNVLDFVSDIHPTFEYKLLFEGPLFEALKGLITLSAPSKPDPLPFFTGCYLLEISEEELLELYREFGGSHG